MKIDPSEKLSRLEIGAYFVLWISSVAYSIYNVVLTSQDLSNSPEKYEYLDYGWSYLNRHNDMPDDEWRLVMFFLKIIAPWIALHLTVAQILRIFDRKKLVPIWYITITTCFCTKTFGIIATLLIWTQPCIAILLILLHSRSIIWIVNIIIIIGLNGLRYNERFVNLYLNIDEDTYSLLVITLSWLTLKSLSCSLDLYVKHSINTKGPELDNNEIVQIFAFMMYLPLLLFGPVQLYTNFCRSCFNQNNDGSSYLYKFQLFIVGLCRYFAWLIFTEVMLHYVYVTALQYNLWIFDNKFWAIYGLGYCMGQFFHLKYVVFYGLSTTVMKFENIEAPPTPKCIAHIHLYSYMWKHFDYGLYTFLIRYIYIPNGGNRSQFAKIISQFLCFTFVFIWHGMQPFIFVWSLLNYLGVILENVFSQIIHTHFYQFYIHKNFSKRTIRRLTAVLATPLMISSALSNFFFFGGMEVGTYFIRKVYEANYQANIILFFCMYTLCQVSMECMLNEKNMKKRNKIK